MPPPTATTETGFSPVASKALPVCLHVRLRRIKITSFFQSSYFWIIKSIFRSSFWKLDFASTNTASRHHKMAFKTAKRRHILRTAKHCRHIFAFSLKFIMRLAYAHMQIANTKNNHSSLHDLCKPAKPVIITRSFANQPSQSSSQDLRKTVTHQHQKVILRLICMDLPTSKNTNAHMTTSKAWSDTSALFMSRNQSTTNVSNIAEENRQQVEQIPFWWPAKQKTTTDSIVVANKTKDHCSIICCDLNSWQASRHRSVWFMLFLYSKS